MIFDVVTLTLKVDLLYKKNWLGLWLLNQRGYILLLFTYGCRRRAMLSFWQLWFWNTVHAVRLVTMYIHTFQDARLVPGGGATEIELAKQLITHAEVSIVLGKDKYDLPSFFEGAAGCNGKALGLQSKGLMVRAWVATMISEMGYFLLPSHDMIEILLKWYKCSKQPSPT